jgi:hypothetical protein
VACAAAGLAAPALAAAAPGSAELIAAFERIRLDNGLPGGLVEVPGWSEGCALHNAYRALNGGVTGHLEDPGARGYTPAGDDAARGSVLASGPGLPARVPFLTAPYHLAGLLMPQLSHTGAAQNDGHICVRTVRGAQRRVAPRDELHVYPGDGRRGVPASEAARELPSTPGQEVGIPQGAETGPHIMLFADGPWSEASYGGIGADGGWRANGRWVRVGDARLEGPGGEVPVAPVDGRYAVSRALLPTVGMLIPLTPLAPGASYRVTAELTSHPGLPQDARAPVTLRRTWWFATADAAGGAPEVARLAVSLDRRVEARGAGSLAVRARVVGVPAGARPAVTLSGAAAAAAPGGGGFVSRRVALPNGRHLVCASSSPVPGVAVPARICETAEVGARRVLGMRRSGPRRVTVALDPRVSSVEGTLIRESARTACPARGCRPRWIATRERRVVVRADAPALAVAAPRRGVRWRLVAPPVSSGLVAWRPVSVVLR